MIDNDYDDNKVQDNDEDDWLINDDDFEGNGDDGYDEIWGGDDDL